MNSQGLWRPRPGESGGVTAPNSNGLQPSSDDLQPFLACGVLGCVLSSSTATGNGGTRNV